MGFAVLDSMMLIIHIFMFVLCYAYHAHSKMS